MLRLLLESNNPEAGANRNDEDGMKLKSHVASVCAIAIAASAIAAPHASSQPSTKRYIDANGQEVVIVTRPRARSRVVVTRRSFLDAGTEVKPGERKFMDYADPPGYQPYNVVTNLGGRVGWHRSPLPGPFFPWGP
jgi:hypothetical protein